MRRPSLALAATALAVLGTLVAVTPSPAAPATPAVSVAPSNSVPAYWLVSSNGGVFTFGGAPFFGSAGALKLAKPIVGMAGTPSGGGYWLVASDGGIFSYGNAPFLGSTGAIRLNKPIVGMTPTPDGGGYWLVATDGGIFAFGDAKFYGSTGSLKLNQPIVGMAATPDGGGYWLVASDGGIFSFGDANFWGSTGSLKLNKPIIGMISGPTGVGYVLVASDGGTFSFGTAPFFGSLGGIPLKNPIVASAATPAVTGYWFTDTTGEVSAFGAASYYGSAPAGLTAPVIGMAEAPGTGAFVGAAYPSGSYGYDVSKFNMNSPACTTGLPSGVHDIGVVEVDGEVDPSATPADFPNSCLKAEAAWAGAGLNLYTFLGNQVPGSTPQPLCIDTASCFQIGYNAGVNAFQDATAAGVNTSVGWWLDVEGPGTYWTTSTADNAATLQGALSALHNTEGIADVGIYASPGTYNTIVGSYQPSVPYWMADWFTPPSGPETCADIANQKAKHQLPTGPDEFVQYSSSINGADGDYAC
ncbi:MAG TPA: hypothetical protein VHV57_08710 [Acidimicrobiales bacterium]|jgi:hypothetical protein|nr:hypothetical protein [Acidimicrobiales bacterium]